MIKQYNNLFELIEDNLSTTEPSNWKDLFHRMEKAKIRGYLTKDEFLEVCIWKSPRPKRHYLSNSEASIKEISGEVFSSNSDEVKIGLLTTLKGVGIPVASAILTLLDPKNYVVLDLQIMKLKEKTFLKNMKMYNKNSIPITKINESIYQKWRRS